MVALLMANLTVTIKKKHSGKPKMGHYAYNHRDRAQQRQNFFIGNGVRMGLH